MTDTMEEDPSSGVQSSSEDEEQVESLIRGRAKRNTAGRHMSALIDATADDDLTLLFEEIEDDNEFAAEAVAEAEAQEDDMGLDSSSDDDEDQGPDAQNDYEGEKELQKEERKKRKAQNDLRFQALRKRVQIDPTAVSAVPPNRPKKKSERISWIPTPEDGPTRSSSRRQTMQNKELTHARLKDSQEKRVRIIATMKEAEKRKAHLKPREMTQEDHLAEAERVERLNSKSLNRWEEAEKRKAEERRAKIEALQNRRLEGPVMSYWSGLATWVNGHLTRVGRVDIKQKPEKDEARRKAKKLEKEEKAALDSRGSASLSATHPEQNPSAQPKNAQPAPVQTETVLLSEPGPLEVKQSGNTAAPTASAEVDKVLPEAAVAPPAQPNELGSAESRSELWKQYPRPVVEVPPPREPWISTAKAWSGQKLTSPAAPASEKKTDAMDIDPKPIPTDATTLNQELQESRLAAGAAATQVTTAQPVENGKPATVLSTNTPVGAETVAPQAFSAQAAPNQPILSGNAAVQGQANFPSQAPVQHPAPAVPPPPPVIEHTGRNLTILENFDDKTAHSRQFNIYFNAKKPPRLTSMFLISRS